MSASETGSKYVDNWILCEYESVPRRYLENKTCMFATIYAVLTAERNISLKLVA